MKFSYAALVMLCAMPMLRPAPALAADTPPAAPATAVYLLGAGDALTIRCVNFPELNGDVTVSPDGKITVPIAGTVSVTGQSTAQTEQQLTRLWSKYYVHPVISVSLAHRRPQMILFYGFTAKVGPVDFPAGTHLVDALVSFGGAAPNGDLSRLSVTHKNGQVDTLDLSHPETRRGSDVDIPLQPDDVVYVPERHMEVGMLGEVGKPGSLDYHEDMTVLDALTQVGGVKDTADLDAATLIRNGVSSKLDLRGLLRKGDLTLNAKLAPGDVISVPERHQQFSLLGEVQKTGSFDYKDDMTVLDALTAEGGVKDTADLENATLLRDGKTLPLNLKALLQDHDMSVNIPLQPGDTISVPFKHSQVAVLGEVQKPGSFDYQQGMTVLDAITAAGGVAADADFDAATLQHDGEDTKLDLNALLRQGDLSGNTKLAPGDRIMVPDVKTKTYVFGAVGRPGYYILKPGDRVLDAVNDAGGPIHEADLNDVHLIHVDKTKNTASVTKVKLSVFLTKGDMKTNVEVQPGDILFIPDKKHHMGLGDVFGTLSGVGVVASTVRLLTGGVL